jgi:translation initiation factor IF-1
MWTAPCLAMVLLGASPPAWVHHSGAMFDRTRVIEVKGVIKEFAWTNPHSSFKVEVDDQVWSIEMNGTSNLVHEGWKKTTIKPGDKVTVSVNPLRDGRPGGWFVGILLPNGSTLGMPGATSEK